MAPAASSLRTSAPSRAAFGPSTLIFEPARVGRPSMSNRFLTANGTPTSGPRCRPASISAARFLARSARTSVKALTVGSAAAMRFSAASITALAFTLPAAMARVISPAVAAFDRDRSWPEDRRRRQFVVELDAPATAGRSSASARQFTITLARYSGAIGRPIALAASSTQRAMSGLSSAMFPPSLQAKWQATWRAGPASRKTGISGEQRGSPLGQRP